jgi:hypothetical protein
LIQKLGILLALAAALAATIISVINGDGLYEFSVSVVVSAVVFYIIGTVIKWVMEGWLFKKADAEVETEESTDPDEEE